MSAVTFVCSFLLQDIPSGEESARVQCDMNVRHLIMKTQMHDFELYGFIFLLNSCAWLEKLTIDIDQQKIYEGYEPPYPMDLKKFWDQGLIIYECLRRSLKVVEVKGLRGTVNELQACNYLIRAASGLEQLKIEVKGGTSEMVETRRAFARLLLTVPKASPNLQISIA
ncbi:hypothetical protein RJT34_24571 [Clitoria ternatea]|uniref:FBD domain-containing protein n=1 Tax=Clitoria ternatea TaxID=43366 RepID=A0AAN9IG10_CLITE